MLYLILSARRQLTLLHSLATQRRELIWHTLEHLSDAYLHCREALVRETHVERAPAYQPSGSSQLYPKLTSHRRGDPQPYDIFRH